MSPISGQSPPAAKVLRGAYDYFDLFRFVAASLVMVSHARDLLFCDFADAQSRGALIKGFYFITGLGHEAVVVFFVLSGFWISSSIDRRQQDPALWRNYAIDRFARLYIVLIPALVLTLVWDSIGIHALHSALYGGASGAHSLNAVVTDRLGPLTFLGNLAFLQTIAVTTYGSNGPLWSLANEFWYYIAYPGLFLLVRRGKLSLWLLALPLVLAFPALLTGFAVWLMGVALHYATRNAEPAAVSKLFAQAVLAASAGGVLVALLLSRNGVLPGPYSDLVLGLAFTTCLWALMQVRPNFPQIFAPLAAYGSKASFSLYLSHFPFVALLVAAFGPAARMQPDAEAFALFGAAALLALAYGRAFAFATEDRTHLVRRWLKARLIPA